MVKINWVHCHSEFNLGFDPKTGVNIKCDKCASVLNIAPSTSTFSPSLNNKKRDKQHPYYNETLERHLTTGEIAHYRGGRFTDGFPDAWDEPGFVLKTSASR